MIRLIAIALLLLTSSTAMAAAMDLPNFFTPVEEDLSVWYLGNIFGSELVQHAGMDIPDQALMSRLFSMFNQVALVVGLIIIIYTMLTGTLNTANEGKPLGEKWNSMWMPVRSLMGIALLVPKGGSGYVLSQYIVMWLTLQGIGAADTIWTAMVNYFEEGGAIRSQGIGGEWSYMNEYSLGYSYNLQSHIDQTYRVGEGGKIEGTEHFLLENMVCMDAYNSDADRVELGGGEKYSVYLEAGANNLINFGARSSEGTQCGQIRVELMPKGNEDLANYDARTRIYTNALYNMARGLSGVADDIVRNEGDDKNWENYYNDVQRNAHLFINYITGYQTILDPDDDDSKETEFEQFKRYGWILAGNYYTTLANLTEQTDQLFGEFIVPETPGVEFLYTPPYDDNVYYRYAYNFMEDFSNWDDKFIISGTDVSEGDDGNLQATPDDKEVKKGYIGIVDVDAVLKEARSKAGGSKASKTTVNQVEEYMRYLTGTGSSGRQVAQDPIIRAANYGKDLTAYGLILILSIGPLLIGLNLGLSWGACTNAWAYVAQSLGSIIVPGMIALGVLMYTQGAMLGIFLPLIPFITFFIGVLGWMMQVVESVAAAPIVALGLIFPETRDDIWGRAAPAYMLILNLFLRPGLMIIGFAAAMIMMWIAIEMLNLGFLVLTTTTFRIEDMFGFVTILFTYSALLIVVATKVYSLINMVPNKVLHWIGDQSMGVQGAEEAIGGAKQGTEAGASSTAAGAAAGSQKGDMYRGEMGAQKAGEKPGITGTEAGQANKAERDAAGGGGKTDLENKQAQNQDPNG